MVHKAICIKKVPLCVFFFIVLVTMVLITIKCKDTVENGNTRAQKLISIYSKVLMKKNGLELWDKCLGIFASKYGNKYIVFDGLGNLVELSPGEESILTWDLKPFLPKNWDMNSCMALAVINDNAYLVSDVGKARNTQLYVVCQPLKKGSLATAILCPEIKNSGSMRYVRVDEDNIGCVVVDRYMNNATLYRYSLEGKFVSSSVFKSSSCDFSSDPKTTFSNKAVKAYSWRYLKLYIHQNSSISVSEGMPFSDAYEFLKESTHYSYASGFIDGSLTIARWSKTTKNRNPELILFQKHILDIYPKTDNTDDLEPCQTWAVIPSNDDKIELVALTADAFEIWEMDFSEATKKK